MAQCRQRITETFEVVHLSNQ